MALANASRVQLTVFASFTEVCHCCDATEGRKGRYLSTFSSLTETCHHCGVTQGGKGRFLNIFPSFPELHQCTLQQGKGSVLIPSLPFLRCTLAQIGVGREGIEYPLYLMWMAPTAYKELKRISNTSYFLNPNIILILHKPPNTDFCVCIPSVHTKNLKGKSHWQLNLQDSQ